MKRDWKIIYSNYSGMEKKAVELVSAEVGAIVNRDGTAYTLYTLTCETSASHEDKNIIVIGTYDESEIIRKYIRCSDIPQNGYVVKVFDNPDNTDYKIALLTGMTDRDVFYAAVDFSYDYISSAAAVSGGVRTVREAFDGKMPDYFKKSAPCVKKRSVFSWGHTTNDYRDYLKNMALLKLNQLIIWNDFLPINSDDIVAYAHEYEIEILWGYAWGWSTNCTKTDMASLKTLEDKAVNDYKSFYHGKGDGIYFQSFTEMADEYIDDVLVADAVTQFVNNIAKRLFEIKPDLHIQFGLHASSVKDRLEYIANVDKRIEIVWEDCGEFPYSYMPVVKDEKEYEKTVDFTRDIVNLRDKGYTGLVYKGLLTLDWTKFAHQSGPYIMGVASRELIENDLNMITPMWRYLQGEWMTNGHYIHDMTRRVIQMTGDNVTLCMVGMLAGGIWLPYALCAEMMWSCEDEYSAIVDRVSKRKYIKMA